jgi:hypothetical protein
MTDAIKKLREPAALAAAAFAALSVLAGAIELLFNSGGNFSDNAAAQTGDLLNFSVALALAIAVFLANHVEPALDKARLITLVSLITAAVAVVLGLVSFFAGLGAGGNSTDKVAYFLSGVGGALVLAVAAWYAWLTWQTHAPARTESVSAAAPQAGGPVGWGVPQGQQPGAQGAPPQQGGPAGQQPGGQQHAGFGWTPGNPNEQTAYIPPQAVPGPQTLQAQQSHSGTFSVPQGQQQGQHAQPGQQPGQHAQPGQPGGQGQPGQPQGHEAYGAQGAQQQPQGHDPYGNPLGQPQPGQPQPGAHAGQPYGAPAPGQQQAYGQPGAQQPGGPQQQAPGASGPQGGGERTQMMPPVPPTMQDYAPDPQPWQPAGPGGAQAPPPPPARPTHPGEQQPTENERNDGRSGPFGVGNWQ